MFFRSVSCVLQEYRETEWVFLFGSSEEEVSDSPVQERHRDIGSKERRWRAVAGNGSRERGSSLPVQTRLPPRKGRKTRSSCVRGRARAQLVASTPSSFGSFSHPFLFLLSFPAVTSPFSLSLSLSLSLTHSFRARWVRDAATPQECPRPTHRMHTCTTYYSDPGPRLYTKKAWQHPIGPTRME